MSNSTAINFLDDSNHGSSRSEDDDTACNLEYNGDSKIQRNDTTHDIDTQHDENSKDSYNGDENGDVFPDGSNDDYLGDDFESDDEQAENLETVDYNQNRNVNGEYGDDKEKRDEEGEREGDGEGKGESNDEEDNDVNVETNKSQSSNNKSRGSVQNINQGSQQNLQHQRSDHEENQEKDAGGEIRPPQINKPSLYGNEQQWKKENGSFKKQCEDVSVSPSELEDSENLSGAGNELHQEKPDEVDKAGILIIHDRNCSKDIAAPSQHQRTGEKVQVSCNSNSKLSDKARNHSSTKIKQNTTEQSNSTWNEESLSAHQAVNSTEPQNISYSAVDNVSLRTIGPESLNAFVVAVEDRKKRSQAIILNHALSEEFVNESGISDEEIKEHEEAMTEQALKVLPDKMKSKPDPLKILPTNSRRVTPRPPDRSKKSFAHPGVSRYRHKSSDEPGLRTAQNLQDQGQQTYDDNSEFQLSERKPDIHAEISDAFAPQQDNLSATKKDSDCSESNNSSSNHTASIQQSSDDTINSTTNSLFLSINNTSASMLDDVENTSNNIKDCDTVQNSLEGGSDIQQDLHQDSKIKTIDIRKDTIDEEETARESLQKEDVAGEEGKEQQVDSGEDDEDLISEPQSPSPLFDQSAISETNVSNASWALPGNHNSSGLFDDIMLSDNTEPGTINQNDVEEAHSPTSNECNSDGSYIGMQNGLMQEQLEASSSSSCTISAGKSLLASSNQAEKQELGVSNSHTEQEKDHGQQLPEASENYENPHKNGQSEDRPSINEDDKDPNANCTDTELQSRVGGLHESDVQNKYLSDPYQRSTTAPEEDTAIAERQEATPSTRDAVHDLDVSKKHSNSNSHVVNLNDSLKHAVQITLPTEAQANAKVIKTLMGNDTALIPDSEGCPKEDDATDRKMSTKGYTTDENSITNDPSLILQEMENSIGPGTSRNQSSCTEDVDVPLKAHLSDSVHSNADVCNVDAAKPDAIKEGIVLQSEMINNETTLEHKRQPSLQNNSEEQSSSSQPIRQKQQSKPPQVQLKPAVALTEKGSIRYVTTHLNLFRISPSLL